MSNVTAIATWFDPKLQTILQIKIGNKSFAQKLLDDDLKKIVSDISNTDDKQRIPDTVVVIGGPLFQIGNYRLDKDYFTESDENEQQSSTRN